MTPSKLSYSCASHDHHSVASQSSPKLDHTASAQSAISCEVSVAQKVSGLAYQGVATVLRTSDSRINCRAGTT